MRCKPESPKQIADALAVLPKLGRGLDVNVKFQKVNTPPKSTPFQKVNTHPKGKPFTKSTFSRVVPSRLRLDNAQRSERSRQPVARTHPRSYVKTVLI